ncbi:MAG TPA: hypothetical protein VHY91_20995 [Pirellulales bacterium]|jgi:hypothetical protein|nr:hypothetical protein [Pirellulales bacterium]
MATRRKSIKILPHDRQLLVNLYVKYGLPIEQLEARPAELSAFTKEWHRISKQKHAVGELLHYMRNERKCGRWVKLGKNCPAPPPLPDMSADDIEALTIVFEENVAVLGHGTDDIAYDDEKMELIAKGFFEITGRGLPAHQLLQKLTALRKRGLLTKVSEVPQIEESGFDDTKEEPA